MEIDSQLCQLLNTLSLDTQRRKATYANDEPPTTTRTRPTEDAAMSDSSDSEDSTYQPSPSQPSSSTTAASVPQPPPAACGCAYLQAIQGQIRAGSYTTTGGDYLETIFTHREALYAFPQGHRDCAIGFSELAKELGERQRSWRPDWDGDSEAVSAFRHEAWVVANMF